MFDFKAPLRDQLEPRRLAIAMWDFSFLLRRTAGEGFEDWDRRLDELVERGYNTVRIDTFPELILAAQNGQEEFLFPKMDRPHFCWGNVAADVTVRPVEDIPLFLRKATCNYASPQITNLWADKEWHQRLNRMFLEDECP